MPVWKVCGFESVCLRADKQILGLCGCVSVCVCVCVRVCVYIWIGIYMRVETTFLRVNKKLQLNQPFNHHTEKILVWNCHFFILPINKNKMTSTGSTRQATIKCCVCFDEEPQHPTTPAAQAPFFNFQCCDAALCCVCIPPTYRDLNAETHQLRCPKCRKAPDVLQLIGHVGMEQILRTQIQQRANAMVQQQQANQLRSRDEDTALTQATSVRLGKQAIFDTHKIHNQELEDRLLRCNRYLFQSSASLQTLLAKGQASQYGHITSDLVGYRAELDTLLGHATSLSRVIKTAVAASEQTLFDQATFELIKAQHVESSLQLKKKRRKQQLRVQGTCPTRPTIQCLFATCDGRVIAGEPCPECNRRTCSRCVTTRPAHEVAHTCASEAQQKLATKLGKNTLCPQCWVQIEHASGCLDMWCSRCRASFRFVQGGVGIRQKTRENAELSAFISELREQGLSLKQAQTLATTVRPTSQAPRVLPFINADACMLLRRRLLKLQCLHPLVACLLRLLAQPAFRQGRGITLEAAVKKICAPNSKLAVDDLVDSVVARYMQCLEVHATVLALHQALYLCVDQLECAYKESSAAARRTSPRPNNPTRKRKRKRKRDAGVPASSSSSSSASSSAPTHTRPSQLNLARQIQSRQVAAAINRFWQSVVEFNRANLALAQNTRLGFPMVHVQTLTWTHCRVSRKNLVALEAYMDALGARPANWGVDQEFTRTWIGRPTKRESQNPSKAKSTRPVAPSRYSLALTLH